MSPVDEALIESVSTAWRERDADKRITWHPSWYDLDDEGRREAFARTASLRRLEAALDPEGLSTTARAVLDRLR